MLRERELHSVCESLACPNRTECFSRGTATFMILGDVCTRSCGFCNVTTGRPYAPPSPDEPRAVAETARRLGLQARRRDLRDARRSARTAARSSSPRRSASCAIALPQAAVEVLTLRLPRQPRRRAHRRRGAARLLQPQRRDRSAALRLRPPGLALRALARRCCARRSASTRPSSRSRA